MHTDDQPWTPKERMDLGRSLLARDCIAEAIDILSELYLDYGGFEATYFLGAAMEMAGKLSEAFMKYEESIHSASRPADRQRSLQRRDHLIRNTARTHGLITIESIPTSSQCLVTTPEGTIVHLDQTPMRLLLDSGVYILRVAAPEADGEPSQVVERRVRLHAGESTTVELALPGSEGSAPIEPVLPPPPHEQLPSHDPQWTKESFLNDPLPSPHPIIETPKASFGPWPYLFLVSGVVGIGSGAGLALASLDARDRARELPDVPETWEEYELLTSRSNSLAIGSYMAYGVGGILFGTGAVLIIYDLFIR